jgi:hypothetical protein
MADGRFRLDDFEVYNIAREFRKRVRRINGYIAYLKKSKQGGEE